jgi:tetratricopeptide (TPR) repeat protein
VAPPSEGLPAPVAAQLANTHAELAEAYAEAGALGRSIEQYQRALELGPGYHDLRYRMARRLLEAGRALEAREALEVVLRARPNFVDAQAALGLAHYLSGDALGARAIWRDCLATRPAPGWKPIWRCWTDRRVRRTGAGGGARLPWQPGASAAGASRTPSARWYAYGQGHYEQALAEFRSIAGGKADPRVWAKTGAAALHAGDLARAAEAYLHLAGEDPTRIREAAEGLELVARAAERDGRAEAMQQAVVGLQTIAPERVPGRYALRLAQQEGADPDELVALLPGAIAAAADQATSDSLLALHARLLQQTAGCGQALLQFRAVVRRAQDTTLRAQGRQGAADCAFSLGRRAVSAGRDPEAALWFSEAARMDSTSATGRQALIAFGDVRLRQGDTLAAALAFQVLRQLRAPSIRTARAGSRSWD